MPRLLAPALALSFALSLLAFALTGSPLWHLAPAGSLFKPIAAADGAVRPTATLATPNPSSTLLFRDGLLSETRELMGTVFRVTIPGPDTPAHRDALQAAFDQFVQVERDMSEWRPDSPVSAVNRSAGLAPVKVPPELLQVLLRARQISEASDGAFDVTWAALRGLWRFDGSTTLPTPVDVSSRLPLVAWRKLVLDPKAGTAYLERPGMAIGLGGVAKGYALDLAAAELRRCGIQNFLLDAGGQVYAGGHKQSGRPWRVGIREPRGTELEFFATLEVRDASLSTSGDYEHAFIRDGVRYHHLIDVRTGYPARGTRSATVLAPDALLADACSTAAFVLGPVRALEFAGKMGIDVLMVDDRGNVHLSEGMRSRLVSFQAPAAPAQPDTPVIPPG